MTEEKTTATDGKKEVEVSNTKTEERRSGGRGKGRGRNPRKREVKEFEESIIQISRVTRVVKGGRRMRFRIAVVIGDKKGRVGFGVGKSSEVLGGIQKAVFAAKKNLMNVSIDKITESIPHEVKGKFKSSQILLFPAPKGKGIIAGGAVRKILELAGVKNVLSKMHGSRNALNATQATIEALKDLSTESNPGIKNEKKVEEKKIEVAESDKKTTEKVTKKAPNKK